MSHWRQLIPYKWGVISISIGLRKCFVFVYASITLCYKYLPTPQAENPEIIYNDSFL